LNNFNNELKSIQQNLSQPLNYLSNSPSLRFIKFSNKIFSYTVKQPILYLESTNLNKIVYYSKIKTNKISNLNNLLKKKKLFRNNKYLSSHFNLNKNILNDFLIRKLKQKKLTKLFSFNKKKKHKVIKQGKAALYDTISKFLNALVDQKFKSKINNNFEKNYSILYNNIYRRRRYFIKKLFTFLYKKKV
jgi:hypothetical protein